MSIKLHIGGKEPHPDWKIFDIEERPEVDYVGDAISLTQFADNSIEAIYASHILEHFHYNLENEVVEVLTEWHRVLQPGGKLYLSVPNLHILCWLYLNPNTSSTERYVVMRMMFGGQVNQYDVHRVGFDFDFLCYCLNLAGFVTCEATPEFGIFNDCSSLSMMETLISLNVIATKDIQTDVNNG
jgi:predicted SAM-dependent methyltransferase